jgi:hypothetical protein
MGKTDSRVTLERNLDHLLPRALGREALPGAAARRAAWRKVAGKGRGGGEDRALVLFAAGLVALVAAGAAALALDLAADPFATVVTALVVLNLAAIPIAGLAIVLSRSVGMRKLTVGPALDCARFGDCCRWSAGGRVVLPESQDRRHRRDARRGREGA